MIYILGVHHFYQQKDIRPPHGDKWQNYIFEIYPDIKSRFEKEGALIEEKINDSANNIWINKLDGDWKQEYKRRLTNFIKQNNIEVIFEEGDGNNKFGTISEEVAVDEGLLYKNIEPLESDRPSENVIDWRENKWLDIISKYYDKNKNSLLIVGEHHRSNRVNLDCPIECKLVKLGIKTSSVAERDFWADRPEYLEFIKMVDSSK